jgi:hypothetical protein
MTERRVTKNGGILGKNGKALSQNNGSKHLFSLKKEFIHDHSTASDRDS